jgi:hypothetical protein
MEGPRPPSIVQEDQVRLPVAQSQGSQALSKIEWSILYPQSQEIICVGCSRRHSDRTQEGPKDTFDALIRSHPLALQVAWAHR